MYSPKNINFANGMIDFVCIALVLGSVGLFYHWGKPYQRGFFCNDESLHYPVKASTISNLMLYVGGSVPHILMIMAGELFYWKSTDGESSFLISGGTVPYWIAMAYNKISLFVYGIGMTLITTDIAKYTIGRLNPQFINMCKPNVNCTLPEYQHVYIDKFECTSKDVSSTTLKNMRLSFPSGHASFSAFVMVWIVLYLQVRVTWKGSKLWKHSLQLVCLIMAWYAATSTISDNTHHWSDVLAGMSLGTLIALITAYGISDMMKEPKRSADHSESDHTEADHTEADHSIDPRSEDYAMELRRKRGLRMGATMATGHDWHHHRTMTH